MAFIYESKYFNIEAVDKPLVDRNDGGHIVINPKQRVSDLQKLLPVQAIELMRLLMVAGEAMSVALTKNGIAIGRINYQDNGNWGVFLTEGPDQHFHLYGRAKNAIGQKYGQALHFPHRNEQPELYEHLEPLTSDDILAIKTEIERLLLSENYLDQAWGILC